MAFRLLAATLLGAVLAFGWGAFAWTSGLYDFAFRPLPGSAAIAEQVASVAEGDGAFGHPPPPDLRGLDARQAAIAQEAYREEHRRGPLMMILLRHEGTDPMSPTVLARGFAIEFFASGLLAAVIGVACRMGARLRERLALGFAVPMFAMLAAHGVQWNFFRLPDAYSLAVFADGLVSWTLAGIACALVVRPGRP